VSIFDVKHQDKALETLQLALQSDRLAHAYIFCGPDGVGKTSTAREFAKTIMCSNQKRVPTEDSDKLSYWLDNCGQCRSCKLIDALTHPDYHLIYKELITLIPGRERHKATEIAIDVIRQEIIEKLALRPSFAQAKVFVILEAHRLSRSAQNALLKTLEEPPGGTYLILITERLSGLLPTIRSRAQAVTFGLLDDGFIHERLTQAGADEQHRRFLTRFAPGQLGLALELLKSGAYDLNERIGNDLVALDPAAAADLGEWVLKEAEDLAGRMLTEADPQMASLPESERFRLAIRRMLAMVGEYYHDALRRKIGLDDSGITNIQQTKFIDSLATRFDSDRLQEKIDHIHQTQIYLDRNVNQKLLVANLFVKLAG